MNLDAVADAQAHGRVGRRLAGDANLLLGDDFFGLRPSEVQLDAQKSSQGLFPFAARHDIRMKQHHSIVY